MWRLTDRSKNPREVAEAYAAELGRTVDPGTVAGKWDGYNFAGEFRLADGVRWYSLRCEGSTYTVEPK